MGVIIDFMTNNAVVSIIIISFLITFASTLSLKLLTDQTRVKELRKKQKELSLKLRELQKKGDFTKMEELNKEVLDVNMDLMKSSFSMKQFLITTLPLLLLYTWMKNFFAPLLKSWIWVYFGASLVSSMIVRKILKMD
jgi:uncharacterized membrane protein (DUF106 family)